MFKKTLILGSLIPVLIYNTISYDLPYGTFIKPIKIKNYIGEDLTFPDRKVVTTVLFFNIANKYHHNIISQINYLLINLRLQDVSFNMICVSKGDSKDFQSLNDQLHLQCQLINDKMTKYQIYLILSVIVVSKYLLSINHQSYGIFLLNMILRLLGKLWNDTQRS